MIALVLAVVTFVVAFVVGPFVVVRAAERSEEWPS